MCVLVGLVAVHLRGKQKQINILRLYYTAISHVKCSHCRLHQFYRMKYQYNLFKKKIDTDTPSSELQTYPRKRLRQLDFTFQSDICRRRRNIHVKCTLFGNPTQLTVIIKSKSLSVKVALNSRGISSLQVRFGESLQLFDRTRQRGLWIGDIYLGDFTAIYIASVFDLE